MARDFLGIKKRVEITEYDDHYDVILDTNGHKDYVYVEKTLEEIRDVIKEIFA